MERDEPKRSQGSADPPAHVEESGVPYEMQHRSYNADAFVDHDDERPRRAKDGAREPAPGEANPLGEPSRDQRRSSLQR